MIPITFDLKVTCDECSTKMKYVRSEKSIMGKTTYIYYCEQCKKEIKRLHDAI